MDVTAWIIVLYRVSGIHKLKTSEVKSKAYWGQIIPVFSFNRGVAFVLLKDIFITWFAKPAKMTHRLRIKIPAST
jgi:hypothetical protein